MVALIITTCLLALISFWLLVGLIKTQYHYNQLEKEITDVADDIVNMGKSFQSSIDEICNVVNAHSDTLTRHQKAIDYIVKEVQ